MTMLQHLPEYNPYRRDGDFVFERDLGGQLLRDLKRRGGRLGPVSRGGIRVGLQRVLVGRTAFGSPRRN